MDPDILTADSVEKISPLLRQLARSRPTVFPGEHFEDHFVEGAVMNTREDSQGEYFATEALLEAAVRFNTKICWLQIEHDLSCHPVGRILAAGMVSEQDGHTQLYAVIGVYPRSVYKPADAIGQLAEFDWHSAREPIPPHGSSLQVRINKHKLSHENVSPLLACSEFVEPNVVYRFEKSEDPFAWLVVVETVCKTVGAAWAGKKLLEPSLKSAGEALAETTKTLWANLRSGLCKTLAKVGVDIGVVHEASIHGCTVRFLIRTRRRKDLETALEALHGSVYPNVSEFLSKRDHLDTMTFEYNLGARRWQLVYAYSTLWGIVADRPRLVDLETLAGRGLSPGGHRRGSAQGGRDSSESS